MTFPRKICKYANYAEYTPYTNYAKYDTFTKKVDLMELKYIIIYQLDNRKTAQKGLMDYI